LAILKLPVWMENTTVFKLSMHDLALY